MPHLNEDAWEIMRSNSKSRPKGSVISRYCILSITCNVLFTEANHSIFPSIGHRKIHEGSLSFFPAGTMDAREQIFDTTLTKLRDDKVTDKDFSGVYRFTFQSNGGIGSGLNLGQENQWDADTLKTSTTLRKATWQAGEQAKFKTICITLLIRVTHYSPEESQKMWDALTALTTHKSPLWFLYLRRGDLLEIMWNSMFDSDVLYEKLQPIAYPFTVSFAVVIETEVKLRYSAWIEALYKRDLFNKLESMAKSVRFLHVCKRVVLAQLKLDPSSDRLESLRVDAGTTVTLAWAPVG